MTCPNCNEKTKVIDSRTDEDSTERRRECTTCGKRFTTYERIDNYSIYIVKKDGRRELFDIDKVKTGIIKSCEKRPVSMKKIDESCERIWQEILQKGVHEIYSEDVGTLVMEELKKLDLVAYVRFASVYRQFKDINTFMDELAKLLGEK